MAERENTSKFKWFRRATNPDVGHVGANPIEDQAIDPNKIRLQIQIEATMRYGQILKGGLGKLEDSAAEKTAEKTDLLRDVDAYIAARAYLIEGVREHLERTWVIEGAGKETEDVCGVLLRGHRLMFYSRREKFRSGRVLTTEDLRLMYVLSGAPDRHVQAIFGERYTPINAIADRKAIYP